MVKKLLIILVIICAIITFGAIKVSASIYTESDAELIAKTVYGEARGCTQDEMRLVVWTILQRVGADGFPDSIEGVVLEPKQFQGYRKTNPVDLEIYELVVEELKKWASGEDPPTYEPWATDTPYYYFDGRDGSNWFRAGWAR